MTDGRFQYVTAPNMQLLVQDLNRRATESWFKVIYISDALAVIDMAPELVAVLDDNEFDEIRLEMDKPAPGSA